MNRGVLVAVSANVVWGLSPLYWRLVDDVAPVDVIVFRILATALLLGLAQSVRGSWAGLAGIARDSATRRLVVVAALLLAANWLVFVWAVTSDRVLEASLGYFMTPLVSVVLGVAVLGERLRFAQWTAVVIAAIGVVVLSFETGGPPWVSLTLAGAFGIYGLLRKTAAVESLDGLSLEMLVLIPIAIGVIATRSAIGEFTVEASLGWVDLWLLGAGVATAGPLLMFAYSARRIPLSLVGVLQYIVPTLQFLLGVVLYNEAWSGGQVVGYIVVWCGLGVFALEGLRVSRRVPRPLAPKPS